MTPTAIKAGKLLAKRLFAQSNVLMDYLNVPTTVFTPLEYGSIGYTEVEAKEKFGDAIKTYHTEFKPLEWSYNKVKRPDIECYMKLIVNSKDNNRIIGFHIACPNAGEVTQGFEFAFKVGITKD